MSGILAPSGATANSTYVIVAILTHYKGVVSDMNSHADIIYRNICSSYFWAFHF